MLTRTTTIWNWDGETNIELTEGQLDDNARHAFTTGQCHALALALHELTGWELGGIGWCCAECGGVECPEHDDIQMPNHVVVRDPAGRTLDVDGWDVESRWTSDFEPVESDDLHTVYPDIGYLHPDLDTARIFAPLVLEAANAA